MDLQLTGSKVLVTGASRGIGLGIAREFAREGCELVLVARSADRLEQAAEELRADGARVETIAMALGVPGAAQALAERCPDIDVLVNNAGAIPGGGLVDVSEQAWREGWDLKVFGYINLARAYLPLLQQRPGGGVIVNIIGAAGEMLDPGYLAGSVGNAALIAFTKALGSTSIERKVRVVGINPGPVATERHEAILRQRAQAQFGDAGRWAELRAGLPHGRAAQVEEVAALAAMLASPRSAYTSGVVVNVDGGLSLRRRAVGS